MNKAFSIILLYTLFSSCIKEESTNHEYIMENKTGVKIDIISYTGSTVIKETSINPNSSIVYAGDSFRGKHGKANLFFPGYGGDSILIIFEDKYEVLHVPNKSIYSGIRKTIDTNSNRIIVQEKGYEISIKKETR